MLNVFTGTRILNLMKSIETNKLPKNFPKKKGKFQKCGRPKGSGRAYPKCVPASKARSMSKKEKESATRRKRAAQNKSNRGGKSSAGQGKKPINVSTHTKGRKSGTGKGS